MPTAFQLVIEDSAEHIAPKRQIEVAGQHPQAGQGLFDRPFPAVLRITAVVVKSSVPVFESFPLDLRGGWFCRGGDAAIRRLCELVIERLELALRRPVAGECEQSGWETSEHFESAWGFQHCANGLVLDVVAAHQP